MPILIDDIPLELKNTLIAGVVSAIKHRKSVAYPHDPVGFMCDVLGWTPSRNQVDILEAVSRERHILVKKCHSSGGTALMARIALWFIHRYPRESCVVITTAPTARQVQQLLWREMRTAFHRSKVRLPGRMYETTTYTVNSDIYAIGFSADNEASVPGFHADHVLVLIDEAAGIDSDIRIALLSATAGGDAKVVEMSQPLYAHGPFYEAYTINREYYQNSLFSIAYYDTPNFNEEEEDIPGLIGPTYVQEMRLAGGGEESDLFRVRCLGEFPKNDESAVIPLGWIEQAVERWKETTKARKAQEVQEYASSENGSVQNGSNGEVFTSNGHNRRDIPNNGHNNTVATVITHIGSDIAAGGQDKSVNALRSDYRIEELQKSNEADTMITAAKIAALLRLHPSAKCNVDVIGVGTGVYNRLRDDDHNDIRDRVHAFNAAESTDEHDKATVWQFINRRSAAWWHLRELLDPLQTGGSKIELPPDPYLIGDLSTPTWTISGQRIKVESKDKMKERIGRSTDDGDAVVMSFYQSTEYINVAPLSFNRRSPNYGITR